MEPQSAAQSRALPALDRQVLEHSRRWVLSGIYLRCTICGAGQAASESNRPFVHDSGCACTSVRDYPWHDLACILALGAEPQCR
ncbi:hypothetical protein HK44_016030 [Pseudomonas fluorescens HK44]|uniref:Uncharacterized protein n=1 Tax=Pseudomonas fluorescens HK44 TaxID=1042209 RepID=A0A010RWL3_PSEFL|nr:hypothetical protein [Pseudomonas fluorescens]EXF96621.1 hypothetical protein HK44_016030 [Pseudomonas fluorescens HK44]